MNKQVTVILLLWMSLHIVVPMQVKGGSTVSEVHAMKKNKTTRDARIAVDKAWETYHHAALGGTLASPIQQTQLEENLHQARAILAEAYEAEDRGDREKVIQLLDRIFQITSQVISKSQEPKL